jgi:hypothetical protein
MRKNRGRIFLLGAAASGWLIYNMAAATDGPSQPLALMQHAVLAVLAIMTIYSGAKWLVMK